MPTAEEYRNWPMEKLDAIVMKDGWAKFPTVVYDFSPLPLDDVTAVVASYRVVKLIRGLVTTFKTFYPTVPMVVVDDTGQFGPDEASGYIRCLSDQYPDIQTIVHTMNQTHGPSLHEGIVAAKTPYVFTLDSDIVFQRAGLLEAMKRRLVEANLLAIGEVFDSGYIATATCLWNREGYLKTPGLVRHSFPTIAMLAWFYDHPEEFLVEDCSVWEECCWHIGAGTRDMYDSPRGWWDPSSPGAQDIWVGSQAYRGREYPELN